MQKRKITDIIILVIFMVTVYVVRHCEAEGNTRRIYQGHTNLDITEMGEKQLEKLSMRFKNIHIDKVYSSPLLRARKTAAAVVKGKNVPIIDDEGLIELHGGDFEGMEFAKIFTEYENYEYIWQNKPQDFCAPNGESMRELYLRVWKAVSKIAKENEGKTVAVASHGGAIRALLCKILFNDVERLNEVPWSSNTAVTKLIFNGGNVEIEFMNDVSHLPRGYLPKRSRIDTVDKKL